MGKQIEGRFGGYCSFWSGSFRCSQQGNCSGQAGGGFVAGTGFKPGGGGRLTLLAMEETWRRWLTRAESRRPRHSGK